jgi:RNA polymerase sigma-70 factor (ECF subfamily)
MDGAAMGLANEQALVDQAAVEPSAFAAIYDHYFPRVYNYARYRVRDAQTAEDITSQVFERALNKIGSYRPEQGAFAHWLFAIARNAVADHYRSSRRWRWLPLDFLSDRPSHDLPPEEVSVRDETWARVLSAVAQLGQRERDLVALKFGARLMNREIAALTGLSESNVSVILYRTVKRLRGQLEKEER